MAALRAFARSFAVALAFLATPWMCPTVSAQMRPQRTALAIHWGSEDHPANLVMDRAIREALASHRDVSIDYFAEYLESDRFTTEEASLAFVDYLQRKYRDRRIDLVIATANPALQFVLDHEEELFPNAPIVFSGVELTKEMIHDADGGITGVLRGGNYSETLKLALELHRSTERVFVVARSLNRQSFDAVQAELNAFSRQVTLTYVDEETLARLLAVVKAIPPRSLVLYVWHTEQDSGLLMYPDEVARLVAQASPVPVYGVSDLYVGVGVVGGVVRGTREAATRAGRMALEILKGKRPQDIPVETARLVPTFDWRQIQRWRIDPVRLPRESDIRFRVPTAWESYRGYIIGTVIVVSAQLLLIAGLLTHRARRRLAEETVRTREASLRTSYERIRQLAGRLINAQEAARADIGRDLHDDVCQELVGVSMAVSSLKRSTGDIQDGHTQKALSTLQGWALHVLESVRRLSYDLHPATLRLVGLASALQAHCIEVERRREVQVDFSAEDDLGHLHPDVELCLFRIAQEALRNGVVHGSGRRLAVSIAKSTEHVELIVADHGDGFDLEAVRRAGKGLGLLIMEERAHMVGGDMRIVTKPGEGTTIRVRVPAGAGVSAKEGDAPVTVPLVAVPDRPTSSETSDHREVQAGS